MTKKLSAIEKLTWAIYRTNNWIMSKAIAMRTERDIKKELAKKKGDKNV